MLNYVSFFFKGGSTGGEGESALRQEKAGEAWRRQEKAGEAGRRPSKGPGKRAQLYAKIVEVYEDGATQVSKCEHCVQVYENFARSMKMADTRPPECERCAQFSVEIVDVYEAGAPQASRM